MKNEITQKIEAFVSDAFNEEMKNKLKNGEADQDVLLDYCLKKAWVDATLRERFHAGSSIIHNKADIMMILKSELCHNNCIITRSLAFLAMQQSGLRHEIRYLAKIYQHDIQIFAMLQSIGRLLSPF